jgi:glycosyltransferase involved in cell wall biosynthesis
MIKDVLTIVIPCKNEENYIIETLASIHKQIGIEGTRIIIADAFSTDNTRARIELFANYTKTINIEIIDGGFVSYGRNLGANLAQTKLVLFIDADTILYEDDIITKSVDYMLSAKYDILTCKIRSNSKSIMSKIFFKSFYTIQRLLPETFSTGVYMMVRKSDFVRLGGFDETLHQSEDYFYSRNYKKSKFKILNRFAGQDDRRFKKMGYIGMLKLLISNYINRNNISHFQKDTNYWN